MHVPFCTVRCGYCDFNTYTVADLGTATGVPGASRTTYAGAAVEEVRLARRVLGRAGPGGDGVPRRRHPDPAQPRRPRRDAGGDRRRVRAGAGAEVTTEANPDSVTKADLVALREAGFTRISFGMQSAVTTCSGCSTAPTTRRGCPDVVAWARAAGFDQISLDLIYGTPGESLADWEASLDAALACAPDHVSAYSLIVEDGTALARRVRRGVLPMPDEDDLADKYAVADARLTAAGLGWYEVSNWAATRGPGAGTTSSTGPAQTGGASAPARTPTSAACGGGTSGTPRRTPSGWRPGSAPPTAASCSTRRPGGWSGCCWSCG